MHTSEWIAASSWRAMRVRRALIGLAACVAANAAPGALARSGLEHLLMTPACILGTEYDAAIKMCGEKYPDLREPLLTAHNTWRIRNTKALEEISTHCQRGLATLYRDLGIGLEGIERVRKAALALHGMGQAGHSESLCRDTVRRSEGHTFKQEELEQTRSIPLSLAFMELVDPDFLSEPPSGMQANYHRDRKLHFARSYGSFTGLRTGLASLGVNCGAATVEFCQRANSQRIGEAGELARRERLPSGDERVTYIGSKMLFRGTFSDNQPVGREERVFLLDPNGRIKDAWDRVQLLKKPDVAPNVAPSYAYSCELYGKPTADYCSVRSVEP